MLSHQTVYILDEQGFLVPLQGLVSLRGPMLTGHLAGPTLRGVVLLFQMHHRISTTRRAQKFPSARSLSISLSNIRSATIFLSRAFSFSSSLRRLAS